LELSLIIPVYNSQDIVGSTVERCLRFFDELGSEGEVILVNDGSKDDSWEVISRLAAEEERVIAVDLLKNNLRPVINLLGNPVRDHPERLRLINVLVPAGRHQLPTPAN